jgi:PAS domain S-box-containing protein
VAGDTTWYAASLSGGVPYPSVSDGFYLAGYPLLAAGLLALTRPDRRHSATELLDAVTVALGAALLSWPFVFAPTIELGWSGATAVSLGYSTGDVFLLAILIAACLKPGRKSRSVSLLALGFAAIFLADVLTYVAQFTPTVASASVTLLWLGAYVVIGVAGLERPPVLSAAVERSHSPVARLVGVGLALLAIPGSIAVGAATGNAVHDWAVYTPVSTVVVLLVMARGITLVREVSRSTERAESTRQRLATVLDTAGVGILFRTNELMTESNSALQEMLGYTGKELAGMSYVDVIHEDEVEEARALPIVPAGTRKAFARRFVRRDGSVLAANVTLTATADGLSVAVIEDVTERRQLESQLGEVQKLEAVGRLAGGIAHDFNNLLTAVSGHAELLRRDDSSAEDRESIAAIVGAAAKAGMLTRQLVAFSRSNSFTPEVLDVPTMVRTTGDLLSRVIPRNISVETRIASDAPMIFADPTQIDQVLFNLAVNARDAMPEGGLLQIHVDRWDTNGQDPRFATAPAGTYCRMAVSDDGTGMDEATRARIFEPFFTTKEPGKGTGLGLSTIWGIVSASGGHIRVDSQPGCGTTFEIVFPACAPAACGITETPEPVTGDAAVRARPAVERRPHLVYS